MPWTGPGVYAPRLRGDAIAAGAGLAAFATTFLGAAAFFAAGFDLAAAFFAVAPDFFFIFMGRTLPQGLKTVK